MEENPLKATIQRLSSPEKKKEIVFDWLKIPPLKRVPRKPSVLAKNLGIELKMIDEWAVEAKIGERKLKTEVKVKEREAKNYSSKDYFLSNNEAIDKAALAEYLRRPNSSWFEKMKRVTGQLTDKPVSVKVEINADDIDKINKKADAELDEFLRGIQTGGIQEV